MYTFSVALSYYNGHYIIPMDIHLGIFSAAFLHFIWSYFEPHFFISSEPIFSRIFSFHPDPFSTAFLHFIWTYFQLHFCISSEPIFSNIFSFHLGLFSAVFLHFTWTYFWPHFFISPDLFSAAFSHFIQADFQLLFQLSSIKFSDIFPDFWMFHLTWWPTLDYSIPDIPHYFRKPGKSLGHFMTYKLTSGDHPFGPTINHVLIWASITVSFPPVIGPIIQIYICLQHCAKV